MQDDYEVFGTVGEHLLNRNPVCPVWPLRMNNDSYIQSQSCILMEEESHLVSSHSTLQLHPPSGVPNSMLRRFWSTGRNTVVVIPCVQCGELSWTCAGGVPFRAQSHQITKPGEIPMCYNKSHNSLPCSVTLDINNHPRAHEGVCFTVITPLSTGY